MGLESENWSGNMMQIFARKYESNCANRSFAHWKERFGQVCLLLAIAILQMGCLRTSTNEVVVYVALDREFSEPILKDLETEMKLTILAKFDQESNKTVGLVNDILQNQARPRGDLFWNNEIMHTLRLHRLGLLDVYPSPSAKPFPTTFVSPENTWFGFAARARVLIVNKNLIPNSADYPTSLFDLADPKWKGKCGMAKPLFGTTATHAAVLFEHLGEEAAEKLLQEIANNAVIEGGNKTVATRVSWGRYAWGLTDTDDAIIELEQGQPIAIVFPDQQPDQMGTLLIPNTICLIKNGPNSERAKILLDRILQADIEERLAQGRSAQIPLNPTVKASSRVLESGKELKMMQIDFEQAAENWEKVSKRLESMFR
jgi:iron(III) transport system substrate-binding protein